MASIFKYKSIQLAFHLCSTYVIIVDTKGNCPCDINIATGTTDCQRRNLTSVPACAPLTTRFLILVRNDFETLQKGQFAKFRDLQELELSVSQVQYLNAGSFQGHTKLTALSLGYNELRIVNASNFVGLSNLNCLFLQKDKLRYLSDYTFTMLPQLILLNLSRNSITHISGYAFTNLVKLEFLSLTNNPLYMKNSLPVNVFSPLIKLTELHFAMIFFSVLETNSTYFGLQLSKITSLRKLHSTGLQHHPPGPEFNLMEHLEELYLGAQKDEAWFQNTCVLEGKNKSYFNNLRNLITENTKPTWLSYSKATAVYFRSLEFFTDA